MTTNIASILAILNFLPPYLRFNIKTSQAFIGFGMLTIALWAQNGFPMDGIHLLFLCSNYGAWLGVLAWINGWVYRRKTIEISKAILQLLLILIIQWVVSNVCFFSLRFLLLGDPLVPDLSELKSFLAPSIASRIIDMGLFIGLLIWFEQKQQLSVKQIELAEKDADSQRNKLKALKNQLNPHFLFNTMHSIASLIGHQNEKAHKLTIQTSNLLRKMLEINDLESHSLQSEWEFVKEYLSIEEERFRDRLKLEIEVNSEELNTEVPTMIIQPLVENALKHGIAHLTDTSSLKISIQLDNERVLINVVNDLPPFEVTSNSTGTGLDNLKQRLFTYYGEKATLKYSKIDGKFIASIKIPTDG